MTAPLLIAFLALDAATDALLWPLFRRWEVANLAYQVLRLIVLRLPMLYVVCLWAGPLGVLLCLVLIWAAPMDTLYHVFGGEKWRGWGRFGIPLGAHPHDHKGPIIPSLAARLIGASPMDERGYRTASVAAGLAVLACSLAIDVVSLLS